MGDEKTTEEPERSGTDELSQDEIQTTLEFDPFAEDRFEPESMEDHAARMEAGEKVNASLAKDKPKEAPVVAEPEAEAEAAAAVAPVVEAPPTPVAPAPAAVSDELSILRAQLSQQGELIRTLTQTLSASRSAPAGAPAAPAAPVDDVKVPEYNFSVPEQLVTALADENPAVRRGALGALIQGTAQTVHREVIRAMRAEAPEIARRVSREEQSATSASNSIFSDFYAKYPQFKTPEIMGIVSTAANEIMAETGMTQWSDQLRDAIALRTQSKIQSFVQRLPVSAPVAKPLPSPTPRQPAAFIPGAKASGKKGNDVANQVADLLGL